MNDVALVVIDMQNDFCLPDSSLFVAGSPKIVANVARIADSFRSAGAPVVMVFRQHRDSGLDVDHTRTSLFSSEPFLVDSPGFDLVEGVETTPSDVVVIKRRWSAFFATDLDLILRRLGVRSVVLAGVQTPNCIRATANDATSLDYRCIVLSDATASANDDVQNANLFDMSNMGVEIATVADIVERLSVAV